MEVPVRLIRSILEDDMVCAKYYNFNNNAYYFNGFSYQDIERSLLDYLIQDLQARVNNKVELPIEYYIFCVRRIAAPYNNPTTLTCNQFYNELKKACTKYPYNRMDYIEKFELEEFFDTNAYYSGGNEKTVSKLEEMVKDGIYQDNSNFDIIAHFVSIGYPNFNDQKAYEYIFRGVIDYGFTVNDSEYTSIMQKFASLVANASGLSSCKIVITSDENFYGSYYPFNIDIFGSNNVDKKIELNNDNLSSNNLLKNLQTIFHEVGHGVQATKPCYGNYETLQFAKDLFLEEKFGEDYYDENYWNVSYEVDARRISTYTTMQFLDSFTDTGKKKFQSSYRKDLKDAKLNNSRNLKGEDTKFYSDIDSLFQNYANEAIGNDKIRNILLQEYNETGSRKLITEFLESRNENNKEFFDSLIYKHNYTLEEIKDNALALMFYKPDSLKEKIEIGSKITVKLLGDLNKDIRIKGLNKIEIEKSKLKRLKSKINLLLKQSLGKDMSIEDIKDDLEDTMELNLEDTMELDLEDTLELKMR